MKYKKKHYFIPLLSGFETTLFGAFVTNSNAGGQVSNRDSYHSNPQYLINIPKQSEYMCEGNMCIYVHTSCHDR